METKQILNNVEEAVSPILTDMGYELIERELIMDQGRWTLRLYIDKTGGVTIDDCTLVSHSIEDIIEVRELIPHAYNLEISSPGIDRPLRKPSDFEQFKGFTIRIRTNLLVEGRMNFKGTLEGMINNNIQIIVDGTRFNVPIETLAKARLVPDMEPKKGKVN